MKYIFYENIRYFSLLFGENGLDNRYHFTALLKNHKSVKDINRLIEEQRFLKEKSKELISSNYNSINSHSLVSLWSSIEAAIEDTIVLIFMYGQNSLYDLKKSGYDIKKFNPENLLSEDEARKFYKPYERQVSQSVKSGIGEVYSCMFKVFGLNLDLSSIEKDSLSEINAIRNCIMHRGGIFDKKAQSHMPNSKYQLGQVIIINNEIYLKYSDVINKLASGLLGAVVKSKYIVKND